MGLGYDYVIAFPSAEIAVMGPEGASNIIFRQEIEKSDDPEKTRQEKIQNYKDLFAKPYTAAKQGFVDAIIEPRYTRKELANYLELLSSKRESRPNKKHGNIPL